jgi:hypothetical protein
MANDVHDDSAGGRRHIGIVEYLHEVRGNSKERVGEGELCLALGKEWWPRLAICGPLFARYERVWQRKRLGTARGSASTSGFSFGTFTITPMAGGAEPHMNLHKKDARPKFQPYSL